MKTYNLKIAFQEKNIGIEEKSSEGITVLEARVIISILEEYKQKMVSYVMFTQNKEKLAQEQ